MAVPDVAWQVIVAVPEVVYPRATVVHAAPAARVFVPAVQSPAAIFHPPLGTKLKVAGTLQAGGSQQSPCAKGAHGVVAQLMLAALLLMEKPTLPQSNAPPDTEVVIWAHVARPVFVRTVVAATDVSVSLEVTMVVV